MPYQKQTSATWFIQVFWSRCVGNQSQDKSWSLVFHFDQNMLLTDSVAHFDFFARIILMAMFDSVDDGFFQHQVDAENMAQPFIGAGLGNQGAAA